MPRLRSRVRVSFPAPDQCNVQHARASPGKQTVLPTSCWPDGRVVMQRIANPCTPVRFRLRPPIDSSTKPAKAGFLLPAIWVQGDHAGLDMRQRRWFCRGMSSVIGRVSFLCGFCSGNTVLQGQHLCLASQACCKVVQADLPDPCRGSGSTVASTRMPQQFSPWMPAWVGTGRAGRAIGSSTTTCCRVRAPAAQRFFNAAAASCSGRCPAR